MPVRRSREDVIGLDGEDSVQTKRRPPPSSQKATTTAAHPMRRATAAAQPPLSPATPGGRRAAAGTVAATAGNAGHERLTSSPAAASSAAAAIDACPISFLTGIEARVFWEEHYEKGPRLYEATPARTAWAATSMPSTSSLISREGLRWCDDVVACRYADGRRTDLTPPGSAGAAVAPGELKRLMDAEGATLQVHHPQRWASLPGGDAVWRLVSALERDLCCLVSSNNYITPGAGAQGLAPHWDDVDVWVVQLEGRKRWRLWRPRLENLHAMSCSGDLPPGCRFTRPDRVELDVILSPGDVLYIPRGTVHEAATERSLPSNHITISAFQRWTKLDAAKAVLEAAVGGDPFNLPVVDATTHTYNGVELSSRRSLGPGALARAGFGVACLPPGRRPPTDAARAASFPADLVALLRAVASHVESHGGGPTLFDSAMDILATDFFASRIRPFPSQVQPVSGAPTIGCAIACRAPGCFRLYAKPALDESGSSSSSSSSFAVVQSCLGNSRSGHMCGGGGGGGGGDSGSDDDDEEGKVVDVKERKNKSSSGQDARTALRRHAGDPTPGAPLDRAASPDETSDSSGDEESSSSSDDDDDDGSNSTYTSSDDDDEESSSGEDESEETQTESAMERKRAWRYAGRLMREIVKDSAPPRKTRRPRVVESESTEQPGGSAPPSTKTSDESGDDDSSSSDEDDDDDDDDDGDTAGACAFEYSTRFCLAAALAATPAAPLTVVAGEVERVDATPTTVTTIPHSLAMELWNLGAVYVL